MKYITCLLIAFFLTITPSRAEGNPPAASFPKADLEITIDQLSKPNTFLLSARYCGRSSVVIVRPRFQTVDIFGSWGGWSIKVQGPGGEFYPFTFPGVVPPFTSLDLINLRTDESIGVILNLSNYTRDGKSAFSDIAGKYTITVSYHLPQDVVPSANGGDFISVPKLQPAESKNFQFTI